VHSWTCSSRACLIDSLLVPSRSVREGLGTPYWMAPELVRAEKGDDGWQKADVWGIGCVMIEMATGNPPWVRLVDLSCCRCSDFISYVYDLTPSEQDNLSNPLTAMFQIASATAIPLFPPDLSAVAHAFLSRCFVKDPAARASAAELLQHPFLTGNITVDYLSTKMPEPIDPKATDTAEMVSSCVFPAEAASETAVRAAALVGALLTDEMSTQRTNLSSDSTSLMPLGGDALSTNTTRSTNSSQAHLERAGTTTSASTSRSAVTFSMSSSDTSRTGNGIDTCDDPSSSDEADNDEGIAYSSDEEEDLACSVSVSSRSDLVGSASSRGLLVRAIAAYAGEDDSELALHEGDVIEVLEMAPSGWWRGRRGSNSGRSNCDTGWFPSTYVERVDDLNTEPSSSSR
jgi:serine/threonine protein kinase